ncbi:hypothetical protein NQ317_010883 [Molorchus minor]|uniref:Uncharacterized protein n=1 Tax=Molorchus minor TaxID=1323400 RepID=A0ABQ9JCN1_9CUCU|nr:hypothetical protein NQ317_010883 [Molorchus minor]
MLLGSPRDWNNSPNPTVFNIGGVLSGNDSEIYFKETIDTPLRMTAVVIMTAFEDGRKFK